MADKPKTYTESEMYDLYNDMLDEVWGDCELAGMTYSTSRTLKEVDPTAYDCGFNDWLDSEEYDDFEGEYAKRDEIEAYFEELEQEKEDAEEEEEEETTND